MSNSADNKLLSSTDQEKIIQVSKESNTHAVVNGNTKPVDQPVSDNKKQNQSDFVSFPKKAKYIEVIEL